MEGLKLPYSALPAAFTLVILTSAFFAAAEPSTATVDIPEAAAAPLNGIGSEPYPGFYDLWQRCIPKLTDECGRQVMRGLFMNKEHMVTPSCCVKLVGMGHHCHRGLMKALLLLPDLTETNRKEIETIDHAIWSRCLKNIVGQ